MLILALDTALGACSAAVVEDGAVRAWASEAMARGHQERLADLVRETMDRSGRAFGALDRIAVTVGPGSFTGLRVGMAFAKAMALALDRPCVGVGVLAALAASVRPDGLVVAAVEAGRGQIYLQAFGDGEPVTAPAAMDVAAASARLVELSSGADLVLVGSAAERLAPVAPRARVVALPAALPEAVARLGASAPATPPRPLYLRAPDARLPAARL